MAINPPIGNNFWEGVLGVVRVEYNNIDRGKTTADTELTLTADIKDIIFQQNGTQYNDKVPTGSSWIVVATFGEISTTLIADMLDEATVSGGGNSLKVGQSLYFSYREKAKPLELIRVTSDGVSSIDPFFKFVAPLAYPEITGGFQWGADTQRNLQVTFHLFYDDVEQVTFYNGYASSLGITP